MHFASADLSKVIFIFAVGSILIASEAIAQDELTIELDEEIPLNEELRATSDQVEGIFIRLDEGFVHSDEQAIVAIVYNDEGEQKAELGSRGDRSYEYAAIMDMYAHDDEIYLIAKDGRRLTFGLDGEEIRQIDFVEENYRKFEGTNDQIYALPSNPEDETALYHFEIGELNRVSTDEQGEVTREDRWLRNIPFAGGMVAEDEQVFWVNPATTEIFHYASGMDEPESHPFDVSENWRDVPMEASEEEIQEDPSLLAEFIRNRSVVNGLYDLGDNWLVEIGHNHDNTLELIVLEDDFEKQGSVILPDETFSTEQFGQRIRMADESGIYFYNETINDDGEVEKLLSRWKLSR